MSHTTTLSLTFAATTLATLVSACGGTEAAPSDPVTKAEQVSAEAKDHVREPWEQRCRNLYYSDRAMSDVWQRHPELIGR